MTLENNSNLHKELKTTGNVKTGVTTKNCINIYIYIFFLLFKCLKSQLNQTVIMLYFGVYRIYR